MNTDKTYEYTTSEIKIRRASKINKFLKMTSVIILLILASALAIVMSSTISYIKKMEWTHLLMGPDAGKINPLFVQLSVSISLLVIAAVLSITIIALMIMKNNFNLYKLSIIVFTLILAGFFISFYKLTVDSKRLAYPTMRLSEAEQGFLDSITPLVTTMCVFTFTYLPVIGTTMLIDARYR